MARRLRSSFQYQNLKHSYLFGLVCGQLGNGVESSLRKFGRLDLLRSNFVLREWCSGSTFSCENNDRGLFAYIYTLNGFYLPDFVTAHRPVSRGVTESLFWNRNSTHQERLAYWISKDDTDLSRFVNLSPHEFATPLDATSCDQIARAAQTRLPRLDDFPGRAVEPLAPSIQVSFQRCLSCHDGSNQNIPFFPVHDEHSMREYLTRDNFRAAQAMYSRIHSGAPTDTRMPPDGTIHRSQRKGIQTYLKAIMSGQRISWKDQLIDDPTIEDIE